jgi:tetratricopeptide (TPR) repeat protein
VNDLLNPYIAGAPVVQTDMFFGRKDVFNWIENSLTGKYVDHILVLHGQRRVGKTTVLKQIPNFLPEKYIQVFFDLQGRTNTTLDRFLWWMASEIMRTLNKTLNSDLPKIKRDQFSESDNFITEFIPSLKLVLDRHVLLLTFDEFDTLARDDIQEKLARPLISFLRRLFDIDGLNFIFSIGSSGNKLENMQAAYTNFFKSALYRKVSFLTKDDCVNLITKPVAGVITYHPKAVQRIIEITSGHPYFTQLTCHELFSRCQSSGERKINVEDVENILDDVIERGTVNLKFVWDEASDLEKWILAILGEEEGISQKMMGQALQSHGVRFSESDLNSAILHLRDKDVLTNDNNLVIHLMKLWLEINRPIDRVREELVQTNPIANRYTEIGDELRDRNQLDEAIDSYQRALDFQDNNIMALLNIADIYYKQAQLSLAANFFEKALQVDNEHIAARHGYCQVQLALGDQARSEGLMQDAIDAYQAILFITPVHRQARQNLSKLYQEQAEANLANGDDAQGLKQLELAIEMTPEDEKLKARHQQIIDEKKVALIKSWLEKADKAVKRKRWDEASNLGNEALKVDPQNPDLQARVNKIKDAPRLEKIKTYRTEAETAIAKGDYNKAIVALKSASILAPGDAKLQKWLKEIQTDQQNAQLRLYQKRADEAQAASNWDEAIAARKEALKLDPENPSLITALDETQAALHRAKLDKLEQQIKIAHQEQRWEDAIQAATSLLALAPDDEKTKNLLEELQKDKRQAHLEKLLRKANDGEENEQWEQAIIAWESYLKEVPEETEKYKSRLAHARQYAKLCSEYQDAQKHIKKKQFNKAIPLLQGIIAQDPTYKSTSRLLVEAVEAKEQKEPIWHKPWFIVGITAVLIIILGFIFSDRIFALFDPSPKETPVSALENPTVSQTPTSLEQTKTEINVFAELDEETQSTSTIIAMISATETLEPTQTRTPRNTPTPMPWDFAEPILAYIDSHEPDISDDFTGNLNQWADLGITQMEIVEDAPDRIGFADKTGDSTRQFWISDGELFIRNATLTHRNTSFNDYVIEVELRPGSEGFGGSQGIIFNNNTCFVYYLGPFVNFSCDGERLYQANLSNTNAQKIRVILKGSNIVFYLNKQPKKYWKTENPGFVNPFVLFASNEVAAFSNFKIWDITDLELP